MTAPQLRVLYGNIAGRRRIPRLRRLVKARRPEVVVLTEAYHIRLYLRLLCRLFGYVLKQYGRRHGLEGPDVAVMVRKDVPILHRELRKMRRRWYGPFNFPRSIKWPRRHTVLELAWDRIVWPLYLLHWPSGGPTGGSMTRGRNAPAWAESRDDFVSWLEDEHHGAGIGDANANRKQLNRELPQGVRVRMSSNVDAVMSKGLHTEVEHLASPPGMHGWGIFTLTKK